MLWIVPIALLAAWQGSGSVLVQQGVFFSQAAIVTFGGAYSVLSYVAQRAVEDFGWLRPGEMLDGLALAETTPGPLILVLQFVAYLGAYRDPGELTALTSGLLGAATMLWVTFVPCFLWIFLGAPYIEALRSSRALSAGLASITAAVVGVILNLSVWFAMHALFSEVQRIDYGVLHVTLPVLQTVNPPALVLTVAALIAVLRYDVPMTVVLAAGAVLGIAWSW
jgi:chromate transporter